MGGLLGKDSCTEGVQTRAGICQDPGKGPKLHLIRLFVDFNQSPGQHLCGSLAKVHHAELGRHHCFQTATEEQKKKLFDFNNHGKFSKSVVRGMTNLTLLEELIKLTPAKDITEAGLFDRENLDMPFSSESKLVALLGDAAHPQTPFLGQGVNMAIADAYVYATNIAVAKKKKTSLRQAISDSDTASRQKEAKALVEMARFTGKLLTSQNFFLSWINYIMCKYLPANKIVGTIEESDESNHNYLKFLDENHCSPEEQEGLKA